MVLSVRENSRPFRTIRSADFAHRLDRACDDNSAVPPLHSGRQSWIKRMLRDRFNDDVSAETVRKWFAGETKPKEDRVRNLATLLDVDRVWLAFGPLQQTSPEPQPEPAQTRGRLMLDRLRRELGGTVTIAPGVDLTDPVGEIWEAGQ